MSNLSSDEFSHCNSLSLADLLLCGGIISPAHMEEALELSFALKYSLGNTLVMCGYTDEAVISMATQLLSMLNSGTMSIELCLRAMKICCESSRDLEDVLQDLSPETQPLQQGATLADLLLAAGIVDNQVLAKAVLKSIETGASLGRSLLQLNVVSETILWNVLNAQVLLRDGVISQQQAVAAISEVQNSQSTFEQILNNQGLESQIKSKRKMKLGELLSLSGFLNEKTLLDALELALANNLPLGGILVENGIIGHMVLERTLQIQKLVEEGQLTPAQSVKALRFIIEKRTSVSMAILELGFLKMNSSVNLKLGEILSLSGMLKDEDINEALRLGLKNSIPLGRMLLLTGFIDEQMLNNTLECQNLLRDGVLTEEQAVIVLNYCLCMHCSLSHAVVELGWGENLELQKKQLRDMLKQLAVEQLPARSIAA